MMAASNKQTMDTMFKCINVLIAGHGKAADKEKALLTISNTGRGSGDTKRNSAIERSAYTAESMSFTSQYTDTSSRPIQASVGQDKNWSRMPVRRPDRDWGR